MDKNLSLSKLILLSLEKSIVGYLNLEDFMYSPGKYLYGYPKVIKKPTLLKTIRRLRERGLIDFLTDGDLILRLTDHGRTKALETKIKTYKEKWDGKWRLVIFDIPEKQRVARDLLRFKLKEWGFSKWQNSVWISKLNCTKDLRDFINGIGIKQWVKVIESDNIE